MLSNLVTDARFAVRMLWKDRRFTLVAVIALALGIGATTAIYTVVDSVLLRSLPFPEPDRLVDVTSVWRGNPNNSSYPDYVDFRDRNHALEGLVMMGEADVVVTGNADPRHLTGLSVTPNLFRILGTQPAVGRGFNDADAVIGSQSVIISHALWQSRYHGDPEIVGRVISLDAKPCIIIGVTPAGFTFPIGAGETAPELYLPFPREEGDKSTLVERGMHAFKMVGRLKPGVTLAQASADFDAVVAGMRVDHPGEREDKHLGAAVHELREAVVGPVRPALLLLLVAVACVLLIACANVGGLLLARGTVRQREVAIRTTLGATRWRIIRQLLTESAMLGLVGGGIGLLLAMWLVDFLLALVAPNLPRIHGVGVDGRILAITALISVVSSVAFGLMPALHASRTDLQEALKESGRSTSPHSRRSRNALLVVEMAVALVLLFGAGLALRSFARLRDVQPGFRPDDLVVAQIELPASRYPEDPDSVRYYRALAAAVANIPGAESVGFGGPLPFSHSGIRLSVHVPGQAPSPAMPGARLQAIGPNYLRTMGMPLLRGRDFTTADDRREAAPSLIVSDEFARRLFGGEDPIGKHVVIGMSPYTSSPDGTDCEIVGVVGDIHRENLHAPVAAAMYTTLARMPFGIIGVAVRTRATGPAMSALREAVLSVDRDLPPGLLATMSSLMDETLQNQRAVMMLLALFAATALVLASIGIYGVMSYTVTQRRREIGIRVAVGASVGQVLRLVLGGSLRLALLGMAIGVVAALGLGQLARSLLYGVTATDPLTLAAVALVLVAVSMLATLLPAWRATRIDPMVALREE
jgi:putative ABC transport system permease protein